MASPAPTPAADLRRVFEILGFYAHPTPFETAISDSELRKALEETYVKSTVSSLLRNLPDLFVLNPDMSEGIFFVKVAEKLSSEEQRVYKEFYPKDILMVNVVPRNEKRQIMCSWIAQSKQQSLRGALKERFGFTPTSLSIKNLEKSGWIV